ncbi:hypothetical protein [Tautonia rosea]|uniref:hypothetical protein n=1 Tax=Tautonia rosea TaxID=2728037 RepID=UPI00147275F3|nr:hypothetical protein [Tautonia rosea]
MRAIVRHGCGLMLALALVVMGSYGAFADDVEGIRPSPINPSYWEYQGETVILLGGSDDDNLFQWEEENLRTHLDRLVNAGGNYIRNTMSSRDEGNLWPFAQRDDGRYDLNRPSEPYWKHFETLLRLAYERDIIVQIEVWDRFDFSREPWLVNPYNPANNRNYSVEDSGLQAEYPNHPGQNDNRFFFSVPALDKNTVILPYQHAQVDRMLSISLSYPNVLYCMDNETSGRPEWGVYWSNYIQEKARQHGVTVHTTEMWDPWNLSHPMHRNTIDHPDQYTFVDISQNNHQRGQSHWDNMQNFRSRLADQPRPINCVKVYGADTGRFGTDQDGLERFWRNLLGGLASTRFHRPDSGQGLNDRALQHLRSARMLAEAFDVTRAQPDHHSRLLSDRDENEAYLTRIPGEQYVVFFTDGGGVTLDLSREEGTFTMRWLDVGRAAWQPATEVQAGPSLPLTPPGDGIWVGLLESLP